MKKRIMIFVMICVCFIVFPLVVFADMGAKPSIDVKIKNLNTTDYVIDLFVYDESGEKYNSEANYNGSGLSDEQIAKLHSLNFDGWISESTRWGAYLLFADCSGNSKYEHRFSYFGTPTKYKIVIINNDTGEIKVSNEIVRKDFNSHVVIDYMSMTIVDSNDANIISNNNVLGTIVVCIIALISTVVIELVVAYVFKIKNYKIIVLTNVLTNLGLQALLLLINNYLLVFVFGEIIVFISELIVYLLSFKNASKIKIALYTLIANMITLICTFLLYKT